MSDYIDREGAYKEIVKAIKNSGRSEDYRSGLHEAGTLVLQEVPSADVIGRSMLLSLGDNEEKIGFLETAKVLRGLVESHEND